ncbi:hypothetical protein F2Q69_00024283 [Brassica cretica]|uniref:Uncharacterized protein n=1 Tax=Brassica cretica TaxID=69181 RepID=A0A8S9QE41_BRACR|nr:hypothetical protein F2Q69_00024283 [Brassica cretica]
MGGSNPDAAGSYSFLNTHKPPPVQRITTTNSLTYPRSSNRQHEEYPEIDDTVVRRGEMKIAASIYSIHPALFQQKPKSLVDSQGERDGDKEGHNVGHQQTLRRSQQQHALKTIFYAPPLETTARAGARPTHGDTPCTTTGDHRRTQSKEGNLKFTNPKPSTAKEAQTDASRATRLAKTPP